jgi:uncharacterized protein
MLSSHTTSGANVYHHLVREVGFRHLDFLFPDVTHSDFSGAAEPYGRFLIEAFDEWTADDNPEIRVRLFNSIMSVLLGGRSYLSGFGSAQPNAFTLRSDGAVELDDFLRMCGADQICTNLRISDLSEDGILGLPEFQNIVSAFSETPAQCTPCIFSRSCRGGQITHRFSPENGFANRSVFCEGLFNIFLHVAKLMLRNGVPLSGMTGLSMQNSALKMGVAAA